MLNEIQQTIELFSSEDYKIPWNKDILTKIENNSEFNRYFCHGNRDGSGGVYFLMYELIKKYKFKHVVELGNREGMGVLAIYEALRENKVGTLTTIDIIKDLRFIPEHVRQDKAIVNFVFGDVLDRKTIREVENSGPIDLILFDTVHDYGQFKKEWDLYRPLLANNSVVLIDDLNYIKNYNQSKQRGFDELKEFDKLSSNVIHSSGFGVVLYDKKKDKKEQNLTDEEFWESVQ